MNKFKSGGGFGGGDRGGFKREGGFGGKKSFDRKPFGGRDDRGGRDDNRGASFGGSRGDSRGGKFGGNGGSRGGFDAPRSFDRKPADMYKATCSNCSKSCEVPFRPNGEKPVFCNECFANNRSGDRDSSPKYERFSNERPARVSERKFEAPRVDQASAHDVKVLQQQVATLEDKMNEVISLLNKTSAEAVAPEVEATEDAPVVKKVAKKTVAKKVAVKKAPAKKVEKKAAKKVAKK